MSDSRRPATVKDEEDLGEDATEARAPLESRPSGPEDMERALRFVHLVEAQTRARVAELSASMQAMLETLIGEGTLPLDAYEKRKRLTVLRENERSAGEAGVEIADVPDKYAMRGLPEIDCASRLHLCRARCCTLPHLLSVQDLDERIVRWDYGRPYRIARGASGHCVHQEGGICSIYAARPGACRAYDCRRDRRIWVDFEREIPAP
jgi:Fe-S-cluster containining protein